MSERFYSKLMSTLKSVPFDVQLAEALSNDIGKAEAGGYQLTQREDDAWGALTELILDNAIDPLYIKADRVKHN